MFSAYIYNISKPVPVRKYSVMKLFRYQTEGARSLEKDIRDGILTKLNIAQDDEVNNVTILRTRLLQTFNEIDADQSGLLSRFSFDLSTLK